MGSMVFDVLESEIFPQGIPILVSIFLFLRQYPSSNARMLKVIYFKCGIIYRVLRVNFPFARFEIAAFWNKIHPNW